MNKTDLGKMICYMWNNADQAPIMDWVETAFVNCPQKTQLELLEAFTAHVKNNPCDWLDDPDNVQESIKKAEKLFE